MEKEYLYVGLYIDIDDNFILKIGTTKDLDRRRYEHNTKYRKAKTHTMPKENSFQYIWTHKLSKYNTLRYEDRNRKAWQELGIGKFVRNDRFVLAEGVKEVEIKIRNTYKIALV
jgi:predicted GIY-YIG superfamily endonuclease